MAAGLIIATAVMPFMASAQTTDVQSQIQSLLNQIKSLQQQLMTLIASSSGSGAFGLMASSTHPFGQVPPGQMGKVACIELNRDLRIGARGEDVKKLQEILSEDDDAEFHGGMTGFFGPMTAKAMVGYQSKFGIGSSTNGTVGPLTRGFFQRRCGEGLGKENEGIDARGKTAGEITAVATSSITVRSGDGMSRVVNVTASTTIHVFATATSTPTVGTMADLTVGKKVAVEGIPQTDGSLTAHNIRVGILLPPPRPAEFIKKIFKFDHRGKMMDDDEQDDDNDDDEQDDD